MAKYSIEDTTLIALGDAVRSKVGETKTELADTVLIDKDVARNEEIKYSLPEGTDKVEIKALAGTTGTTTICTAEGIVWYLVSFNASGVWSAGYIQNGFYFQHTSYSDGVNRRAFEITCYDASGNILQGEQSVKNTMTPLQMAEAIEGLPPAPPESAFAVTGNCQYKFANGGWDWFIEKYGNRIITKNITNADYMFQKSTIKHIPFEINLISTGSSHNMFESCEALKKAPIVNNLAPGDAIFKNCKKMTSLNNIKLRNTPNNFYCESMFSNCYSLRSIGDFFDNVSDTVAGTSIYGMYSVFELCRTLDELVNLPYIYSTYSSSNYSFGNFVTYNCRLKELTFRDGIVLTSGPKGGASLNVSTYVGYSNVDLVQYGMSADKKVTDDASYQALKDDPDWWTMDVNYSRYNHDSAVNTINSLPDLSGMSYTNTITFKGASGSLTDGGAISNLTEEEIAVATAKGWTVKIV